MVLVHHHLLIREGVRILQGIVDLLPHFFLFLLLLVWIDSETSLYSAFASAVKFLHEQVPLLQIFGVAGFFMQSKQT
jgi:hypothetical protein